MKLYEISELYRGLLEGYESGDIPEDAFYDTLHGITGQFNEKAINLAAAIQNMEAQAKAIENARKRQESREKSLKNRIASLKRYLLQNMEFMGQSKVETHEFVVSIANNQHSVDVQDESIIPADFFEVKRVLSKTRIHDALANGKDVPGCQLIQKRRLNFK